MIPLRRLFVVFVVCLLPSTPVLGQDDIEVIRVRLHPPPPGRALEHRLLPTLTEQISGNAFDWYKKAAEALTEAGGIELELYEQFEEWEQLPLDKFPVKEARKELARFEKVFDLIEKGALCENIDWGHREGIQEAGINFLLPTIQEIRSFTRLLRMRGRVELAEGNVRACLRTTRLGFGMAYHTKESPTLISSLVGIAMAYIHLDELDLILEHPKSPSLYWALTDLPTPMFDLRKAFQGERLWVFGTFPGSRELVLDKNAGTMPAEDLQKLGKFLGSGSLARDLGVEFTNRYVLAFNIRTKHEAAKKALIADGRPKEKVEKMPHIQVALLHALLEHETLLDEIVKWQRVPFHEGYPKMMEVDERFARLRGNRPSTAPAIPLAPLFLPAVSRVILARVRIDRKVAALRTVEAIRLHVAKHKAFPETLGDVDVVPVPVDPMTGKPFPYERTKRGATLEVGAVPGIEVSARYRYELRK